MKKIFALLLSFAMLLSFAACGSKPVETAPTTEATQPATQATEPIVEATEPAPAEPVVNKCVIYISSLGTILDAFGKSDCIVGAYGSLAESYNVPSCGKWNEVDVEAVIATGADALFGYKNLVVSVILTERLFNIAVALKLSKRNRNRRRRNVKPLCQFLL